MQYFTYKRKLAGLTSLLPRTGWQAEGRAALASYMALRPAFHSIKPVVVRRWAVFTRPLTISLVLVLVLAVSATGVAAQQSLPTSALYPMKLATEQARLVLTPSAAGKAHLRLSFAQARLAEATSLASQQEQNHPALERTLGRYEDEVHAVTALTPAVVAATTDGAQQEFLKDVRLQLVAQQEALKRVTADGSSDATSSVGLGSRLSQRVKIKVIRALKASSEGETAVLPSSIDVPPASATAVNVAAEAIDVATPSLVPALPATVPLVRRSSKEQLEGVGDVSRAEVDRKLVQAGAQLDDLSLRFGGSSSKSGSAAMERVLKLAQQELAQAMDERNASNDTSGYVRAYRRALKSYQSALDAELDFESQQESSD